MHQTLGYLHLYEQQNLEDSKGVFTYVLKFVGSMNRHCMLNNCEMVQRKNIHPHRILPSTKIIN